MAGRKVLSLIKKVPVLNETIMDATNRMNTSEIINGSIAEEPMMETSA
jgi:hypothetical protein